jgi:hypothetical protein
MDRVTSTIIQLVFTGVDPVVTSLTIGNIYVADYISDDQEYCYIIKNDYGSGCFYPKYLFKTLEEIRSEKLNIILS